MKHQVKTESGSVWELDDVAMTWLRVVKSEYPVRTACGVLSSFPEIKIGEPMFMWGPPFVEGAIARMVNTSPVVEHVIEESTIN
jgi:hypothetical protein